MDLTHNDARVLSTKEAMAFLSVSRATINRNLHRLPARVRLSQRRYGWRLGDLKAWVEAQRGDELTA